MIQHLVDGELALDPRAPERVGATMQIELRYLAFEREAREGEGVVAWGRAPWEEFSEVVEEEVAELVLALVAAVTAVAVVVPVMIGSKKLIP
jgi:hypothetical protein